MAVSEKTTLRHQKWKREILEIIRSTPNASRVSVKRERGLSMDSTLALINELLEENLILNFGKAENGKVGRKATMLRINDDGCYFIGVRFSAGGVTGVCTDFGHHVVCSCRRDFPPQPDGEHVIAGLYACIDDLIAQLRTRRARLRGIGVGAPGVIDLESGAILRYAHIQHWENVPLRAMIEERYGVPTYLEHGVKCSARAIMAASPHTDRQDLLFLQMGRGTSLCVVTDGHIHNGANYLSGEIGHMLCEPGRTLESLTASDALLREAAGAGVPMEEGPRDLDDLLLAAVRGSEAARALLSRAGAAAGHALAAAVMIVNPQDIILSGKLCASVYFEQAVRQALFTLCIPESMVNVRLSFLPADPRTDAAGAAMLPFYRQFGLGKAVAEPDGSL